MKKGQSLLKLWATISAGFVFGVILFLFGYVFWKGAGSISLEFLTGKPKGVILGTEGGIFPAIIGSLCFTGVAVVTASALGISTAVFHVFYCKSNVMDTVISLMMQCMAGLPSIVVGLFGYSVFVLAFGFGKSILAGGLTQAVMILPFIEVRAEKTLQEAEPNSIRASYALGATKSYTIAKVVLPEQLPKLTSDVIMAGLYAIGAAAPLIFTGAVILAGVPQSLMDPAMALPNHLHLLLTQGTSPQNAYGTAFVLMVLVLVLCFLASYLVRRKEKPWKK